jgi:tetratricopeptide (TPR) repeat protein
VTRHRVGFAAGLVVTVALLAGLLLATAGLVHARREAARSQRIADFLQDLLAATDPERSVGLDVDVDRVVSTARDVFGDDHATVAATLTSRALQLQSTGNLGAAEPLYLEAIRIWREHYGEDHLSVAVTLGCLGGLHYMKGDERAAEEALRESLEITKRAGTDESLALCASRQLLGAILVNRGQPEEAKKLFAEALRIRRKKAPQQLVQIAITLNSLANVTAFAGPVEEAKRLAIESAEAYRRALPDRKLFLAKVDSQTGVYLLQNQDGEAAEPYLRRAVATYRENPDAHLFDRQRSFSALYRWLEDQGDDSAFAVDLYHEYVSATRELIGEDDPRMLNLLVDVGERLERIGRDEEAEPLLTDAIARLEKRDDCEENLERARRVLDLVRNAVVGDGDPEPKETDR